MQADDNGGDGQLVRDTSPLIGTRKMALAKPKRPVGQQKKTPAPFVMKLWNMVNDPANAKYIQWTPDGEAFQVVDKDQFEKVLLKKYFKHSKFSSFVRQLNMYGWHKLLDASSGGLQSSEESWIFQSPNFIRGRADLLDNIERNKKGEEETVDLQMILDELKHIRSNQKNIEGELMRMQKDNEMLWGENYRLHERHQEHERTLNRILRFLASLYGNQRGLLQDMDPRPKLLTGADEFPYTENITELKPSAQPTPVVQTPVSDASSKYGHQRISSVVSDTAQGRQGVSPPPQNEQIVELPTAEASPGSRMPAPAVPVTTSSAAPGPAVPPAAGAGSHHSNNSNNHNDELALTMMPPALEDTPTSSGPLFPDLNDPEFEQKTADIDAALLKNTDEFGRIRDGLDMNEMSLQHVGDLLQKRFGNNPENPFDEFLDYTSSNGLDVDPNSFDMDTLRQTEPVQAADPPANDRKRRRTGSLE